MTRTPRRRILITLPTNIYKMLERIADEEERAVDQQASFLLKLAIIEATECFPLDNQSTRGGVDGDIRGA